jgi:hypothetical protein
MFGPFEAVTVNHALLLLTALAVGIVEPVLSATAWAEKMLRNAGNAASDWERGVANPSASPVAGMKKAKKRWANEMTAAITEDRWGKAIDRLTDEEIIKNALAVGGGAFTAGLNARKDKVAEAIARLQPEVSALKGRLDALPVDTDDQREKKMIEAKRGMQAIGRKLAGLAR